jgi:hypothetical protein
MIQVKIKELRARPEKEYEDIEVNETKEINTKVKITCPFPKNRMQRIC